MTRSKKWLICFISLTLFSAALVVIGNIVLDPYFHYHDKLECLEYYTYDPRYINDGMAKYFDYDALITGTSMTENFKVSEAGECFGMEFIKLPYSGASYKEINNCIEAAVKSKGKNLKMVIRCLDYNRVLDEPDTMRYDVEYPTYLYDDNIFNDIKYVLNKNVLFESLYNIMYTMKGYRSIDFDTYCSWDNEVIYGKEALKDYTRKEKLHEIYTLGESDYINMYENITRNVTDVCKENPDTAFYIFFSPYSIYYWDSLNQSGTLDRQLEAEKYCIELLLECENIHLFSFFEEYDMICDINNYKDAGHYSGAVNSQILLWMKEGTHQLTTENYLDYCNNIREFYTNYDYDSLYEE